ncbi:hypothetical protein HMI54_004560, partial [Coelomomyces lativittatus]
MERKPIFPFHEAEETQVRSHFDPSDLDPPPSLSHPHLLPPSSRPLLPRHGRPRSHTLASSSSSSSSSTLPHLSLEEARLLTTLSYLGLSSNETHVDDPPPSHAQEVEEAWRRALGQGSNQGLLPRPPGAPSQEGPHDDEKGPIVTLRAPPTSFNDHDPPMDEPSPLHKDPLDEDPTRPFETRDQSHPPAATAVAGGEHDHTSYVLARRRAYEYGGGGGGGGYPSTSSSPYAYLDEHEYEYEYEYDQEYDHGHDHDPPPTHVSLDRTPCTPPPLPLPLPTFPTTTTPLRSTPSRPRTTPSSTRLESTLESVDRRDAGGGVVVGGHDTYEGPRVTPSHPGWVHGLHDTTPSSMSMGGGPASSGVGGTAGFVGPPSSSSHPPPHHHPHPHPHPHHYFPASSLPPPPLPPSAFGYPYASYASYPFPMYSQPSVHGNEV